jgi:hypothetical protein
MNSGIKWLWNDYKFMYEFCRRLMMIWIEYELSDLNYASDMKKYELKKVFFNKLIIWKYMNYLNFVSYEVCIYLGLNDIGRARLESYEALLSHAGGKDEMSSRASDQLGVDSWIIPPDSRQLACETLVMSRRRASNPESLLKTETITLCTWLRKMRKLTNTQACVGTFVGLLASKRKFSTLRETSKRIFLMCCIELPKDFVSFS